MPVNVYDLENQRGALGQQYVSATANLTNANNIYSQAQAKYEPYKYTETADAVAFAKRDLSKQIGGDFDTIINYLNSLPRNAVGGSAYSPELAGGNPNDYVYSVSPQLNAEINGNGNWLTNIKLPNGRTSLTFHPGLVIDYLNSRLKNHLDWWNNKIREDKLKASDINSQIVTAQSQYSNAQTAQSNAMGQYDQLKFQREKALNAVRSGRMQERLRDNPYKVL